MASNISTSAIRYDHLCILKCPHVFLEVVLLQMHLRLDQLVQGEDHDGREEGEGSGDALVREPARTMILRHAVALKLDRNPPQMEERVDGKELCHGDDGQRNDAD